MKNVNLRKLRYFVAVAEERHLSRAADREHIAAQPLGRALCQLEEALGVQLLVRRGGRLDVTAAGQLFYELARQTLRAWDDGLARLNELTSGTQDLRLALPLIEYGQHPLVRAALSTVHRTFPRVHLHVSELGGPDQILALSAGDLDVGLQFWPHGENLRLPPLLRAETLAEEPLVALLGETHVLTRLPEVTLSELARGPMIAPESHRFPECLAQILRDFSRQGPLPERQVVTTLSSGLPSIALGQATTLMVATLARSAQWPGVVTRPLRGDVRPVRTVMVWPAGEAPSSTLVFLTGLRQAFGSQGPAPVHPDTPSKEFDSPTASVVVEITR